MNTYIWNCVVCNHQIFPDEFIEGEIENWMKKGAAILPDNKVIIGEFNILGRLDNETIYEEKSGKPEMYHQICYRRAGSPISYTQASEFSKIDEYHHLSTMMEMIRSARKEVYKNLNVKLKKGEVTTKLLNKEPRINGVGEKIEDFELLEELVGKLSILEYIYESHMVSKCQAEIARYFAQVMSPAINLPSILKPQYEEIKQDYLKIAAILEKVSEEVKEIKEGINEKMSKVVSDSETISADRPKVSHEDFAQNLAGSIKERGWVVMTITGEIPFVYTIGLYKNFKHPEIMMTAAGAEQASLLNDLGEEIKAGKKFEVGKIYEEDEDTHRHIFVKVENKYRQEYFGKAIEFYNGLHFPVIQRVTADKQEILPWEEDCDPVVKFAQKILGRIEMTDT